MYYLEKETLLSRVIDFWTALRTNSDSKKRKVLRSLSVSRSKSVAIVTTACLEKKVIAQRTILYFSGSKKCYQRVFMRRKNRITVVCLLKRQKLNDSGVEEEHFGQSSVYIKIQEASSGWQGVFMTPGICSSRTRFLSNS